MLIRVNNSCILSHISYIGGSVCKNKANLLQVDINICACYTIVYASIHSISSQGKQSQFQEFEGQSEISRNIFTFF